MKYIEQRELKNQWPRNSAQSVQCSGRDLVVRITDWWTKEEDDPEYAVECYIGGGYDRNKSKRFTLRSGLTKKQAKQAAIEYAQNQISKLL